MATKILLHRPRIDRHLLGWQAGIVAAVLACCVFWPRPGQAVLVIPLVGGQPAAWAYARANGFSAIGSGRWGRGVVVKASAPASPLAALPAGLLVLAVPGLSCDNDLSAPVSKARPPLS